MTTVRSPSQFRYFLVTVQLTNHVFSPTAFSDKITYIRGQVELGSNLHYQLFVYCKVKITKVGLAKLIPGHIKSVKYSPEDFNASVDYCWKDDETFIDGRFEVGTKPIHRDNAVDWVAIRTLAASQRWADIPADILIRFAPSLMRIPGLLPPVMTYRHDIKVYYYWGAARTGKSKRAFEEAEFESNPADTYIKLAGNKWWDGYVGQTKAIIDDFEGTINMFNLKVWFDRYPCFVEVKGSSMPLKVVTFWVTSNYSPDEICDKLNCNAESRIAFKERLTVIHFSRLM